MYKLNIRRNIKIVYHINKVVDKVMINNNSALRYEMPYNRPFEIMYWLNTGTVTLQCSAINIWYNIRRTKPYTSDTNVKDIKC